MKLSVNGGVDIIQTTLPDMTYCEEMTAGLQRYPFVCLVFEQLRRSDQFKKTALKSEY